MKRTVLIFGSIIGVILTGMANYMAWVCCTNPEFESNDLLGYVFLIAVFSFVFVGVKSHRDKHRGGMISFGQAFKTGFYMSLVATAIYVVVWLIDYYVFIPGYLDQYIAHVLYMAKKSGATQAMLDEKLIEMNQFKEWYKNPFFVVVTTSAEVLVPGLIISLISALILKRKTVTA